MAVLCAAELLMVSRLVDMETFAKYYLNIGLKYFRTLLAMFSKCLLNEWMDGRMDGFRESNERQNL